MNMQNPGIFKVHCNSMELAGEIVQTLASYLGIDELQSTAHLPREMSSFREMLESVEEINKPRSEMMVEMADRTNAVKSFVVQAKDAKMLSDSESMRSAYNQLMHLNRDLAQEQAKWVTIFEVSTE
jgi:Bardet-Biedl syndrome 2 protein